MLIATIIDFLHLLAAVTWVGGMIYTNLVFVPSLAAVEPPQRGVLLGAASRRFTVLSWACVVVLAVTGLIEAPSGSLFDVSSSYGLALTIKIILFVVMIVIGAVITFVVSPKMKTLAPGPGEKPSANFLAVQKQLSALALVNMIIGIVILLLIAIP